ncbi:hypothetical protein K439DRAFT_1638233 [Ramaria rubella]|nr:hypothetical protein K439DRAFT_1638233 [Ramaria rubella]
MRSRLTALVTSPDYNSGAVRGGVDGVGLRQSVGHAYVTGVRSRRWLLRSRLRNSLPPFEGACKYSLFSSLSQTWIVDATGVDIVQLLRLSLSVSSSKAHLRKPLSTRTIESVAHGKNIATI